MAGLFDRPQQQPQQGLFGAIFSGMGRGLTNPGGFFVNEGAPAAQALGNMVLSPFVQANQAMPWGGNDPSAIGIDPQTGSIDPSVMVPWATDVAGTVTAGAGLAPSVAGGAGMGIRAYHGSPHDFERFDLGKIGTGEGAQAYGHGLYFAENEAVARGYREALSPRRQWNMAPEDIPAELADLGFDPAAIKMAQDTLAGVGNDGFQAVDALDGLAANTGNPVAKEAASVIRSFHRNVKPGGRTYEVDIDASPDEFLDWDKPLSEQPEKVQAAIRSTEVYKDRLAGHEAGRLKDPESLPGSAWLSFLKDEADFRAAGTAGPLDAAGLRESPAGGADWKIPEFGLKSSGIKGIRYKDAGSRLFGDAEKIVANYGSREKALEVAQQRLASASHSTDRTYWEKIVNDLNKSDTSNYVVFDDKTISILKKYGLAGLTAGGAGAAMLGGGTDQAQAAQPPWMTGGRF